MPQLEATVSVDDGKLQLTLDGRVIIRDSGDKSIKLKDGVKYVVQWFVKGTPGSAYSVKITSPKEAKVSVDRKLNSSGKDHGSFSFTC